MQAEVGDEETVLCAPAFGTNVNVQHLVMTRRQSSKTLFHARRPICAARLREEICART